MSSEQLQIFNDYGDSGSFPVVMLELGNICRKNGTIPNYWHALLDCRVVACPCRRRRRYFRHPRVVRAIGKSIGGFRYYNHVIKSQNNIELAAHIW